VAADEARSEEPDEAYADWPGEYLPVRLPWPVTREPQAP
jgi:hypothetical protein